MKFKVGDRVACIDDNFDKTKPNFEKIFPNLPIRDLVYTVREYQEPAVKLVEIVNPTSIINLDGISIEDEGAFHEKRFAPVISSGMDLMESIKNVVKKNKSKKLVSI
jgi:hypothetical protein